MPHAETGFQQGIESASCPATEGIPGLVIHAPPHVDLTKIKSFLPGEISENTLKTLAEAKRWQRSGLGLG